MQYWKNENYFLNGEFIAFSHNGENFRAAQANDVFFEREEIPVAVFDSIRASGKLRKQEIISYLLEKGFCVYSGIFKQLRQYAIADGDNLMINILESLLQDFMIKENEELQSTVLNWKRGN